MGSGYRADNSFERRARKIEPGLVIRSGRAKPARGAASRVSPNPGAAPSQSPIPHRGEAAQTPRTSPRSALHPLT